MTDTQGPILVAVDFSSDSEAALLWAADYAELVHKPLSVLHIAHEPGDAPGYYRQNQDDLLLPLKEVADRYLTEFLDRMCDQHPELTTLQAADALLVVGTPANRIVEVANKVNASMIVVGSCGRTGLSHLLIGSKALSVAQHAPMPVTIIKASKADIDDIS